MGEGQGLPAEETIQGITAEDPQLDYREDMMKGKCVNLNPYVKQTRRTPLGQPTCLVSKGAPGYSHFS